MALVGGGGAGNVAGSNPSGTSSGLNYIGDHCYAMSGVVNDSGGSSSAVTTMFNFTTGSSYALVDLDLITDVKAGENVYIDLILNGEVIYQGVWDDAPAKANSRPLVTFIIPSFSSVVFKWGSSSNKNATAIISGRVYA